MGRAERRSGRNEDDDESSRLKRSSKRSKTKSPSSASGSGSSKRKKPLLVNKTVVGMSRFFPRGSDLISLAGSFKVDPVGTSKRVCKKLVLYIWLLAVLIAILNLVGFDINPLSGSSRSLSSADGGVMDSVMPGFLRGQAIANSDARASHAGGDDDDEDGGEGGEGGGGGGGEDDAVPEMQSFEAKKPVKLNKAKEKELACKMEDCITSCNKKITSKCAARKTCKTDREKVCRKRCMKARCEERCKDEPHYGYVEREQKMDKCKEGCQGSTAQHNKCIKACHAAFQPCKSRCHTVSNRYKCDRIDDSAPPPPPGDDMDDESAMESESASDDSESSSFDDGEEESSSSASSSGGSGGGGAFDDFDDEVI